MKETNFPRSKELTKSSQPTVTNKLPLETIKRTALNARQYRLISEFVKGKGLTSKQVAGVTGASNPYTEIEKLRKSGWNIHNTHHKGFDRDGRRCSFDRYHLAPQQISDAVKVLEFFNKDA